MWQPSRSQWTIICLVAVAIVLGWPPETGRSLGTKLVNWGADPRGFLPSLPPSLPMSLDDDGDKVTEHDMLEKRIPHGARAVGCDTVAHEPQGGRRSVRAFYCSTNSDRSRCAEWPACLADRRVATPLTDAAPVACYYSAHRPSISPRLTMKRVAIALLLWTGVLASPATAWAKWTRLSSEHFVFVGDASERQIRDIAQRLEQFRDVVGRVFSDDVNSSPVRTVVVVFQNDKSFTPFKPVFQGRPVAVAGYFVGAEDANYIAVNAQQDSDAYGVIFHEYAHFLTSNAIGVTPVWLNEGLAELYETFEASNGGKTALIGRPSRQNLQLLQTSAALMSIVELTAVQRDSPMYNEGDRRGLFYAESWALVHYLTFGNSARAGQLKTYLASIEQGTPAPDAFRSVFGADTSALDRELQRYMRAFSFNAMRFEFDDKIANAPTSSSQVLSDHDAAGYLGDLMARLDRLDDARLYLRKTIDGNTDAARAMVSLGLLELRASNDAVAFPLLEQAAALAPGDAAIQSAYGRALTRRADRGHGEEEALYAKARTVLMRALELEPDNASAMVTLAEAQMGSGVDTDRAVILMRAALKAAPGREEYRLMLAQALAITGDYQGASTYFGVLMARGSRPEIRDAARRALARVADARNAALRLAMTTSQDEPVPSALSSDSPSLPSPPTAATAAPGSAGPPRETMPQGAYVPSLRPVRSGETRVLGTFSGVECRPGAVILIVDTPTAPVRMAAPTFNDVELLTYRQDSPSGVACGQQRPSYRVLATFRTDASPLSGADTPNRAVAIELVPDGFTVK